MLLYIFISVKKNYYREQLFSRSFNFLPHFFKYCLNLSSEHTVVFWKLKFFIKHMPAKYLKHTWSNRSTGKSHSVCWRRVQTGILVLTLDKLYSNFRINQWKVFLKFQNEAHNSQSWHFCILNLPSREAMLHSFSNGSSSRKKYHFHINTGIHLTWNKWRQI